MAIDVKNGTIPLNLYFTVDDIKYNVFQMSSSLYNVFNTNYYQRAYKEISKNIEELEKKELEFLNYFNLEGSTLEEKKEALRKRLDDIYKYNNFLSALYGKDLEKIFISPAETSSDNEIKLARQKFFKNLKKMGMDPDIFYPKNDKEIKKLQNVIVDVLNVFSDRPDKRAIRTSLSIKDIKDLDTFFVHKLTKAAQERINKFNEEVEKKGAQADKNKRDKIRKVLEDEEVLKQKNNDPQVQAGSNSVKIIFSKSWLDYTGGRTQDEAKTISSSSKKRIAKEIKLYILSKVRGQAGPFQNLLEKALDDIIIRNPEVVFVGKNFKDITGLLGEIKDYVIFNYLLFGKGGNTTANLEWLGGLIGQSGKKPHEDIIFEVGKKAFGIQSKNTTKSFFADNLFKDINFLSRNVNSQKGEKGFFEFTTLTQEQKQLITDIYTMQTFNVPYITTKDDKEPFVEGINPTFQPIRDKILKLVEVSNQALSVFASSMLFMQLEENSSKFNFLGNILYSIAGNKIVFASEILKDIMSDLIRPLMNEESHFKIRGSLTGKGFKNIVSLLNKDAKAINRSSREKFEGDLKLTTSYSFPVNL